MAAEGSVEGNLIFASGVCLRSGFVLYRHVAWYLFADSITIPSRNNTHKPFFFLVVCYLLSPDNCAQPDRSTFEG
jgi:hypothetical protein